MAEFFQQAASWGFHGAAFLLCVTGVFLSLLSFTGSWLVAGAAALLTVVRADGEPGWVLTGVLLGLCVAIEVVDAVAGSLGITRRGGSRAAGWAALGGGFVGMFAGGLIPVPLLGSVIGMCAGSFAAAFWVERRRLEREAAGAAGDHDARAAHIATGAVWARLAVMLIKTLAALGMAVVLGYRVWTT